jgi:hypothetical protein
MTLNITTPRTNFIVTRDEHGEDRVWAGVKDGKHVWTVIPELMRELSAGLALELLRDFQEDDYSDGPRVVVGYEGLGPRVYLDDQHRFMILGV